MELKAFLVILGAALAAARPSWRDLHNYTFETFIQEFGLKYQKGTQEWSNRKQIFLQELARVVSHNANSNVAWKENVNHMSAMTATEKQAFYGRSKAVSQAQPERLPHQEDFPANYVQFPVSALPESVDWRKQGVATAVKDQGHCGSCWAFSSTAALESHVAIATGQLFDLSPQQIAACAPNPNSCGGSGNCNGATSELAFDYVAGSKGVTESFQYPYTEYFGVESACAVPSMSLPKAHIRGFIQLATNNYQQLLNAVAREGPVVVSVDASTWHSYDSGIFNGCNQVNPDINHAVVLMGYGEDNGTKYWLIRNSWSASWGEDGYIRLLRTDNDEKNCGSDITPSDGIACAGDTEPEYVCGTCGVLFDSAYPTGATSTL
jgi:cathepsin L